MKKMQLEALKKRREFINNFLLSLIPIVLFFLFWQFASGQIPKGVLSSPLRIAKGMYKAFADPKGEILKHTLISLQHIGLGFLLAGIAGGGAGIYVGHLFQAPGKAVFAVFSYM